MNPDLIDMRKLEAHTLECIARQTPAVQAELREMISTSPIDVIDDDGGFVLLSIEGNAFGRVHRSRLLRVPDHPNLS